MRIIFVGLHNKPGMKPLDSKTKSGKLIDKIIAQLPKGIKIIKSNLFNVDFMPNQDQSPELKNQWYWTYLPVEDDIVVLLGATVQKEFYFKPCKYIKIPHPASKRSHIDMDNYIRLTVELIKLKL